MSSDTSSEAWTSVDEVQGYIYAREENEHVTYIISEFREKAALKATPG